MKKWWWLLFAVLAAGGGAQAAAPDVTMKDFNGKVRNANEFIGKGKWTVVAFWAHNCPICNQEIHQMSFFHDAHRKKDANVLGVSIDGYDNKALAQRFVDDHGLGFTNLLIDPMDVERFGAGRLLGTPTYYLYAPDGSFVAKKVGAASQEQIEALMRQHGANKKP